MLELSDYLGLSTADARDQWKSILERSDIPFGSRQVDFTPVETLLCFGLGLISSPSKSGAINIKESNPMVIQLANLVKRRPGSLAAKLANLDGRRPNGAKHEKQLWIELTGDLSRYFVLYEIAMDAARQLGLDQLKLPDFLGMESGTLAATVDADRVSNEDLRESIDPELRARFDDRGDDDFRVTERVLLGTARIGQKQFARSVLSNNGFSCVFCGLGFRSAGLPPARMLIASHIKAWSASTASERLDVRNGVAACPTHDAAFDSHLISIDSDLSIIRGPAIALAISKDPMIARNFGAGGMRDRIPIHSGSTAPAEAYLAWHRALAFREETIERSVG